MKVTFAALAVCVCCLAIYAPGTFAKGKAGHVQAKPIPLQSTVYRLEEIHIADTIPAQYVWVIYDQRGEMLPVGVGEVYESLASPALRQWVSQLPKGISIITPVGLGQPIFISPASRTPAKKDPDDWGIVGLSDFAHFCRNRGVRFTICGVSA